MTVQLSVDLAAASRRPIAGRREWGLRHGGSAAAGRFGLRNVLPVPLYSYSALVLARVQALRDDVYLTTWSHHEPGFRYLYSVLVYWSRHKINQRHDALPWSHGT